MTEPPSLNVSYAKYWQYFTMMSSDGSPWYEPNNYGTYFAISDISGKKLMSLGAMCQRAMDYHCWQVLPDGEYILRVGGALDVNSGENSWQFCGVMGGSQVQLVFKVTNGQCEPILSLGRRQYCSQVLDTAVLLSADILLAGLPESTVLTAGDQIVLDHVIASLVSGLRSDDVHVTDSYYSEIYGGVVVTLSIAVVMERLGYTSKDYSNTEQMLATVATLLDEACSDGQFTKVASFQSGITSVDSNVLSTLTGAHLISLKIGSIKTVKVSTDQKSAVTLSSNAVKAHSSTTLATIEQFAGSFYAGYIMFIFFILILAFFVRRHVRAASKSVGDNMMHHGKSGDASEEELVSSRQKVGENVVTAQNNSTVPAPRREKKNGGKRQRLKNPPSQKDGSVSSYPFYRYACGEEDDVESVDGKTRAVWKTLDDSLSASSSSTSALLLSTGGSRKANNSKTKVNPKNNKSKVTFDVAPSRTVDQYYSNDNDVISSDSQSGESDDDVPYRAEYHTNYRNISKSISHNNNSKSNIPENVRRNTKAKECSSSLVTDDTNGLFVTSCIAPMPSTSASTSEPSLGFFEELRQWVIQEDATLKAFSNYTTKVYCYL